MRLIDALIILAIILFFVASYNAKASTTVEVDKATQMLTVYKHGEQVAKHKVIIGKRSTPTPTFEDKITHVVLNPKWVVPKSIIREIKNKGTFKKYGFKVEGDKWTQPAGPGNVLGQVKFRMTNPYRIYLHDTGSKYLFNSDDRRYSHGCIRIEYPLTFTNLIAPHINLEEELKTGKTQWIKLPEPIKVSIR